MSRCRAFDFAMRGAHGRPGTAMGRDRGKCDGRTDDRAASASPEGGRREAASRPCRASLSRAARAAIYAATDFTRCYPAAPDAPPAIPYTHAEFATRSGIRRRTRCRCRNHHDAHAFHEDRSVRLARRRRGASADRLRRAGLLRRAAGVSATAAIRDARLRAARVFATGLRPAATAVSEPGAAAVRSVRQPAQYGSQPYDQYGNQQQYGNGYGTQYGTVSNIQPVNGSVGRRASPAPSSVRWSAVGNQFGRGHGRDAATVIGALGGAVAGNQIGQQMGAAQGPSSYRIDVQVSDGTMRSFDVQSPGNLRPGDRVQINGNQLARY